VGRICNGVTVITFMNSLNERITVITESSFDKVYEVLWGHSLKLVKKNYLPANKQIDSSKSV